MNLGTVGGIKVSESIYSPNKYQEIYFQLFTIAQNE